MEKTFPTSVSKTYTFTPPNYTVPEDESNDSEQLIYVDGKGKTYDINQRLIKTPESMSLFSELPKIPLPTEGTKKEFEATMKAWEERASSTEIPVVHPVPMGSNWVCPYPPLNTERTSDSFEYRAYKKNFSIKTSPLEPENYMEMMQSLIDGSLSGDINFNRLGPYQEKIPISSYFCDVTPWYGQLIPQRPVPYLFKNYEDYSNAMKRWINEVSQCDVIPPSPAQLQDLIGVEKQKWYQVKKKDKNGKNEEEFFSSNDYFNFVSRMPGFDEEEDSSNVTSSILSQSNQTNYETSDLMRIKTKTPLLNESDCELIKLQLIGQQHVYSSIFFDNGKHRRTIPLHPAFDEKLTICQKLYDEYVKFGPTRPNEDKMKPRGAFYDSVASFSPPIPEIVDPEQIISLCECLKSCGMRYRLFKKIIALFGKKTQIRSLIFTNQNCLYHVYSLFHEFATQIKDIPEFFTQDTNKLHLRALYSILFEYYITQHLITFFKSYNDKNAIQFLKTRNNANERELNNMFAAKGDILQELTNSVETSPSFCASCIFLLMSSNEESLEKLEKSEFPIITILSKLSKLDPKSFRTLQLHIFRTISLSSYITRQLSAMNYDTYSVLFESSDEFLIFLSEILTQCFPKKLVNNDVSWTMTFLTIIINQNNDYIIPTLQQSLLKSICIFIQNRMWANQKEKIWLSITPQYLTLVNITLPLFMENLAKRQAKLLEDKDNYAKNKELFDTVVNSILTLLKTFRCLCWHPSSDIVINDIPKTLETIKAAISCPVDSISVSGLRTFRYIVMNHMSFLEKLIENKKELDELGDKMFIRRADFYIEMFKFIENVTMLKWYQRKKNIFIQLFIKCHFRLEAAMSTVDCTAQKKERETYKEFCKFLEEKPAIKQMLLDVETQLKKIW